MNLCRGENAGKVGGTRHLVVLSKKSIAIVRVRRHFRPMTLTPPDPERLSAAEDPTDDLSALPRRDFLRIAGVGAGALLASGCASAGAMQIIAKTSTGEAFLLDVEASETIATVAAQIQDKVGIPSVPISV